MENIINLSHRINEKLKQVGLNNQMRTLCRLILFSLISTYFLSSCSMERKLALQFIEEETKEIPVMLVPPAILAMHNDKPVMSYNYSSDVNLDSLSFFQSIFLQHLSDSIFLENYFNSFINSSSSYGFKLYLPHEIENFIQEKRSAYIIRIAQMELIEDTIAWEIDEQINYRSKTRIIPINSIALNSWFEISQKDSSSYNTYFDEQYISDSGYGEYRQDFWNQDIKYYPTVEKLERDDIYSFAKNLGTLHASFLYDLIMNTYIWNHIPEDRKQYYVYLHYNHDYHSIETAERAFIRLDGNE